jgi:hypothetical protein
MLLAMGRYAIIQDGNAYVLYEDSDILIRFKRSEFREALSSLGRGNNWVGSMLKLFLKKYPPPFLVPIRSDFERAVDKYGAEGFADYLRSKGFRVTKRLHINDIEIIGYLESKGYDVEGLLEGEFYSTNDKKVKNSIEPASVESIPIREYSSALRR